jgi:ELWxxDGT repeat protein
VLGGKALFAGFDANGHVNLWVTDGTLAGTSELIVAGADPSGLFYNNGASALNPNFTVTGGKALFSGFDVAGHVNLWVTDGTAAGTSELTAAGASPSGLSPSDITLLSPPVIMAPGLVRLALDVSAPVPGVSISVNGAGGGSVLSLALSESAAAQSSGAIYTVSVADAHGRLSATGSGVAGSGTANLTIVGSLSQVNADLMTLHDLETIAGADTITVSAADNAGNTASPISIAVTVGPSISDFSGRGVADLLWQNDTGEGVIWRMNGTAIIGSGSIGNPGPSWHERGSGDFNGDGRSDILWQNDDGSVAIWEMNGANVIGGGVLGNPGPSWHVAGTGDFNGDGHADILWQNADGSVAI